MPGAKSIPKIWQINDLKLLNYFSRKIGTTHCKNHWLKNFWICWGAKSNHLKTLVTFPFIVTFFLSLSSIVSSFVKITVRFILKLQLYKLLILSPNQIEPTHFRRTKCLVLNQRNNYFNFYLMLNLQIHIFLI